MQSSDIKNLGILGKSKVIKIEFEIKMKQKSYSCWWFERNKGDFSKWFIESLSKILVKLF